VLRLPAMRCAVASLVVFVALPFAQAQAEPELEVAPLQLEGVPFDATVRAASGAEVALTAGSDERRVRADDDGVARFEDLRIDGGAIDARVGGATVSATPTVIPGWLSLLPPLFAILLAIGLRQVVLALAAGVWIGALFVHGFDPLAASLRLVDGYAVTAVADADHASILVFSLLLGGMVGVVTRSGGGMGLAGVVTRGASTPRRGLLATWGLGILIFFDDYANSLLVGSSMRPITDRLRVSREKLAFLVDATAAPVSSLALVSSWIGVEVSYIGDQLDDQGVPIDGYAAFLETLPYRFYPWLMLVFGLAIVLSRRDFGPMLKAERRARHQGQVLRPGATPASSFEDALPDVKPRWINAVAPVGAVVLVALLGMYFTGRAGAAEEGLPLTLRNVFGASSSYKALLWGSAAGCVVAIGTAVGTRAMRLGAAMEAWLDGLKAMLMACVILVLAWSLQAVCKELHTADYVIQGIGGWLDPALLPATVFVLAALVSFATGTSWGTMAILFPLVVPLAVGLVPEVREVGADTTILMGAISAILAGSVWGDHCSPISDTTIMSSMAASCDHVDHVRTQLPYALAVGVVSLVVGELGTAFELYPAWLGLLLGVVAILLIVRFAGREIADDAPPPPHVGA